MTTSGLHWRTPSERQLQHLRFLSDGTQDLAVADFIVRRDEFRSPANRWLFTHVTHGITGLGISVSQRLPAVGLTDGNGNVPVRVAFLNGAAWNRLRGTTMPVMVEPEHRFTFPPLPKEG